MPIPVELSTAEAANRSKGFFSPWKWRGVPRQQKILLFPLTDQSPHFLTRVSPPTEFCPPNSKIYLIFLSILNTF